MYRHRKGLEEPRKVKEATFKVPNTNIAGNISKGTMYTGEQLSETVQGPSYQEAIRNSVSQQLIQDTPLPSGSEDTGTLTGSETDGKAKATTKKNTKKKTKPKLQTKKRSGPTIESQLREVPATLEEMIEVPATQLGASALEWLEDINIIRVNTSIHGGMSSHIKRRLNVLNEVIKVLAEKVEEEGDPAFLRRRNAELSRTQGCQTRDGSTS